MSKNFKKETPQYKSAPQATPYQRAKQEWDDRIGASCVQAANWRFIAILSTIIALLLLILLIISLSINNNKIFVAQVKKSGQVVNVAPLQVKYQPTTAQKEYFLRRFIEMVRSLPLDPVMAKNNWLSAYRFLGQKSSKEMNADFRKNNPLNSLGKKTVTVNISDINPISDKTFQADWTETTTDINGQPEGKKNYSGVFTLITKQPKTQQEIFYNPLGIYIIDFHISPRETKS